MKRFSTFHFHLKGVTPLVSIFETEKTCFFLKVKVTLNKFRHACLGSLCICEQQQMISLHLNLGLKNNERAFFLINFGYY